MTDLVNYDEMNCSPINILLVEDNEADIKITLRAFEKAKLKNNIYVVNDGQAALDFIYNCGEYKDKKDYPRPGIILLDINMPRVDGFEVLNKIKADPEYKPIPVIMLTSSRSHEDILKSYGYGASSYISKPVIYEEFLRVIDSFNFYWSIVSSLPSGQEALRKLPQTRVLIIDDNETDQKLMKRLLNEHGYFGIVTSGTGEDGVCLAGKLQPELILIDTQLPGIDGFETCRRIKNINGLKAKVIIVTGIIEAVDSTTAREAGSDAYCAKTRDCKHLLAAVKKLI